ncbi:ATP-binding protein [Paenibacillus flagellatus]|uniref:histidine kinase n=1 Tax=Paenibacillus flagellatus TaxID=2211139 RepID=A0A2V5K947_9BACL|nr:ATP-binding protein [Paenibacillus flagellatus]PYI54373.1 hybrid sensor histidine kinase/response regulator [Paenibacillus flagellatus]
MIKLLAVDDRPENLLALEGVLASPQYEVVSLRSGEDALRYLLLEDVSDLAVILMDVQMPGLNGFETVKLIKQRERCREIPVIFLTAISTSTEHVRQGYDAGSIDYLFKPIDPDLLRLKVDAFAKLHRYHRQIIEQGDMLRRRALELEQSNRRFAEADALLKLQNERLESMVEERTLELRETNEKLRRSQERFRKMFMSNPCLMAIRRLSDMACIDVNESWLRMTGFGPDTMPAPSEALRFASDAPDEAVRCGERTVRNAKIKYATRSNEWRDGLLSTELIELDGEKCLLEVVVDVTENVRFEKEMSRLAELNLIGEMAAGIAHEIRNPMTTIRGFLQLSQSSPGRMEKEHVDMMLEELDRANGIITEYLSLAKNKQTVMVPRPLNRLVESLLPLIHAEAMVSGKHVQIEYGECPDIPLDEKEIRQLVLNMTLNGLESMSPGGVLRIRTGTDDGEVVLTIADQGHGIREDDLEKLGRPFFTTKENGTGLGLAVCYSIAARHGATIRVTSGPEGTTFDIRFPLPIR